MLPLGLRVIVKRHHPIPVLIDQLGRLGQPFLPAPVLEDLLEALSLLAGLGVRDLPQHQQGRLVYSLGDFGQQIENAVIPASLLVGLGKHVAQRSPDPQVTVVTLPPKTGPS